MNCPACGYYNPPAQQTCFHCALVLPLPAGDALCAAHPEVKATGACSRCGTFGCGACLSARGSDWLCPQCFGRVSRLPWDERETLGVWRAWWQTSVLMISSPVQSLSTTQAEAPLGGSLLFALLSSLVGFGPTMLVYAGVLLPVMMFAAPKGSAGPGALLVPAISVVYMVVLLVFQVVSVLVIAGLDHLGLMVVGAQPKSYPVTVRAYALSMGPYLVGLLPFCSLYVFPIWSIVVRVIANMYLHQTTAGKATAGVLLPILVLCGGMVALYAAVFALAMNIGR